MGKLWQWKIPKLDGLVIAMFGTPPCRCRPPSWECQPWPLRNTKSTPRRCFTGTGCGQPGGGALGYPAILFDAGYASDFFRVAHGLWGVWWFGGSGASHGPMVPWPVSQFSVEVGRLICKNHNGCPLKHRLANQPRVALFRWSHVISVEEDDEGPRGFATWDAQLGNDGELWKNYWFYGDSREGYMKHIEKRGELWKNYSRL